jgi:hypothetical protein
MLNKGNKTKGKKKMKKAKTFGSKATPTPLNTKLPIAKIIDKIKAPMTPILLLRMARIPKTRYNTKGTNAKTEYTGNIARYTINSKSLPEEGKRAIVPPINKLTTEYIKNRKASVADVTADLFQYFIELLSDSIIGMCSLDVI